MSNVFVMRSESWDVAPDAPSFSADATGSVPGQHGAGGSGGREGPGAGAEGGTDTRSRFGRPRNRALHVSSNST